MSAARLEADGDGFPDLLDVMLNVLLGRARSASGGLRWGAKNRILIIAPKWRFSIEIVKNLVYALPQMYKKI